MIVSVQYITAWIMEFGNMYPTNYMITNVFVPESISRYIFRLYNLQYIHEFRDFKIIQFKIHFWISL